MRENQNPQWKLDRQMRQKSKKSKSIQNTNAYKHRQFIPKSKSIKNVAVAKHKQHHTKLYQTSNQIMPETDDFLLSDLNFLSSTKVAVHIEEDIARQI